MLAVELDKFVADDLLCKGHGFFECVSGGVPLGESSDEFLDCISDLERLRCEERHIF